MSEASAALLAAVPEQSLQAARKGRTWPMLDLKLALRGQPVDEAHAAFAHALGRPATPGPVRKPLLALHEAAATGRGELFPLDPGGDEYENRPSRVVGESDHRVLVNRNRPLYVASYPDVVVRGRSQLVEWPDAVGLDFEPWEYARLDDDIELDAAVLRGEGDAAWILAESQPALRMDAAFSLLGPNTYAFGHWIVEYLPRLWLAMESGHLPAVPVLVDAGMARQHREALGLLAPGLPIVEVASMQRVEVGRLWHAPTFYYAPMYPQFNARFRYDFFTADPARFARVFAGMARAFGLPEPTRAGDGARVYFARKPGSHRKLVNGDAIEALARAAGYRCVYAEDLDFAAQLALVRGAARIVGPDGSALFLGFFARPGTRALLLNHPHTEFLTTVTACLEAVGVECTVLTGPFARRVDDAGYVHFSDYAIDPDAFVALVEGD